MNMKNISLLLSTTILLLAVSSCKDKKKTTSDKEKNKVVCNCPKIRVCASKQAMAAKKERCQAWHNQKLEAKNPKAEKIKLKKKELYLTKVNPIGVVKYFRPDNSLACREVDLNGDGLMDLFYFFDTSGKIKIEAHQDEDRDGIIDRKTIFRNGVVRKELFNTDGDENTWEIEKTYNNGIITQIAYIVINPPGSPERVCSKYNYYENFDANGKLISISWDIDCDGDMDKVINEKGEYSSEEYKKFNLKADKSIKARQLKPEDKSIKP